MNSFYTSCQRKGNSLLVRGFNRGVRFKDRIPFRPTLYLPSPDGDSTALDDRRVKAMKFDSMSDARDFIKTYKDIPDMDIYGNTNYAVQYLQEQYPGNIEYNSNLINATKLDIEVYSADGFPHPTEAKYPITAISLKNNIDKVYYTWSTKDFDNKATPETADKEVVFVKCHNEANLLMQFLTHWQKPEFCPDVITGWNTSGFDVPYLINRINGVLDFTFSKKLSPWNLIDERKVNYNGKENIEYTLKGISHLDYLQLFKKFTGNTLGAQESYKLDHIAHVVLGDSKLSYEEYESLADLWEKNPQLYIAYNIIDVELIDRLEDKLGLIELVYSMTYKAGCNYEDTLGTVGIWDAIIYRYLDDKNVVVPPNKHAGREPFAGGYVKDPMVGMHEWVVSFDLASLYPHIIMQNNMSPETIINDKNYEVTVESVLNQTANVKDGYANAANGSLYRKDIKGFLPEIIDTFYTNRKNIKNDMLATKSKLEAARKTDKEAVKDLSRRVSVLDNQQMAIKILMNSLYGSLGNVWGRYYDLRLAEGITTSGQLAIKWAEKAVNGFMSKVVGEDKDYVIAIDTDSLYVNFAPLVNKLGLDTKPKESIVKTIDKMCTDQFEPMIKKSYEALATYTQAYENKMDMDREAIADRGFWTAKKRYVLNVHNNEGVQYDEPRLKIMGIEAIKSSTPAACREALRNSFAVIIAGSETKTQDYIAEFRTKFKSLQPHEIAFPRGVSDVIKWADHYGTKPYKKGCPIAVRAALLYNNEIKTNNLTQYPSIQNGDKIKFTYMTLPNPLRENVFGFHDFMPRELNLEKYVDYDLQFDKTFLSVLEPILDAIGWTSSANTGTMSIEDFM